MTKIQFVVECKYEGMKGEFCEVEFNSRFENFTLAEECASRLSEKLQWRISQVTTTTRVVARKEKSK